MPLQPGGNRGYIDVRGRLWQPGRSITAGQPIEWDVQLPTGGHLNVDLDGNISHGSGKPPRPKAKPKRTRRRRN